MSKRPFRIYTRALTRLFRLLLHQLLDEMSLLLWPPDQVLCSTMGPRWWGKLVVIHVGQILTEYTIKCQDGTDIIFTVQLLGGDPSAKPVRHQSASYIGCL